MSKRFSFYALVVGLIAGAALLPANPAEAQGAGPDCRLQCFFEFSKCLGSRCTYLGSCTGSEPCIANRCESSGRPCGLYPPGCDAGCLEQVGRCNAGCRPVWVPPDLFGPFIVDLDEPIRDKLFEHAIVVDKAIGEAVDGALRAAVKEIGSFRSTVRDLAAQGLDRQAAADLETRLLSLELALQGDGFRSYLSQEIESCRAPANRP